MKNITLKIKNVYGNTLLYPDCRQAEIFSFLIGKKTFSIRDLNCISVLGLNVVILGIPEIKMNEFKNNDWRGLKEYLDRY